MNPGNNNFTIQVVPVHELLPQIEQLITSKLKELQKQFDGEKFLSPNEARMLFQLTVSRGTIYNWIDRKLLVPYYIGGKTLFKYTELIEAAKHFGRYRK